ncbi:MAG TPA: hypothetical protein VEV41_18645 [Terriglobales bacterium]|nr:hypothetical protein [Terriglobales bacterium]
MKWRSYAPRALSGQRMYIEFRVALLLVLGIALCPVTLAPAQTVQGQVQQPAPTPASPAPANLEQLPPNPPTLIYDNGFLIVSAHNSTLGDILRGIRGLTGADIEVPPQADERVFVRLGPALPRDILRSLLAGSRFNYLIVGSDADPNALAKVLLFPKPGTENPPQPLTNAAAAAPRLLSPESNVVEAVSQEPQAGEPPVRAQQRMLQQRREMIMQELQQNGQPD